MNLQVEDLGQVFCASLVRLPISSSVCDLCSGASARFGLWRDFEFSGRPGISGCVLQRQVPSSRVWGLGRRVMLAAVSRGQVRACVSHLLGAPINRRCTSLWNFTLKSNLHETDFAMKTTATAPRQPWPLPKVCLPPLGLSLASTLYKARPSAALAFNGVDERLGSAGSIPHREPHLAPKQPPPTPLAYNGFGSCQDLLRWPCFLTV